MTKANNKTKETEASVDDFLNSVENEQKRADCFQVKAWMEAISGESAKMWGTAIVGFGTYHFKYDSGREGDFMKIGFSPRAQNLTLYIMPGFKRYPELMEKLGKYKIGKSCLYVKKLEDVDNNILQELITESINYMTNKYG
jgi:nucleoid DNA-binding protein